MTLYKIFSLIFLSLFVAACSVTHEYAIEKYKISKTCCKDMSEFEYQILTTEKALMIDINESSKLFNFKSGKSYFVGLKLPDFNQPYNVTLKSYALGDNVNNSHIFFPEVLALNNNFSVISKIPKNSFNILKASFNEAFKENKAGLIIKLEGVFMVDSPTIKYLVILTTDNILSGSTSFHTRELITIILPGIVGAVPGRKKIVEIPHSPFGRIIVTMDNESTK